MALSVNGRNTVHGYNCRDKKMTQAAKEMLKTKKKSKGKVDIAELRKKWVDLSEGKLKALDNALNLNDPSFDYLCQVGTIDFVDSHGVIQWDIRNEDVNEIKSVVQEISVKDYLFWNTLTDDPGGLGLRYSDEEIRNKLSKAGIKPGFFNITVGGRSATQFYSQGKNASAIYSKKKYDQRYNHILSENFLRDFKDGQKFLIGGKEYTLGTDRKLNVPYGADIYDLKWKKDDTEKS